MSINITETINYLINIGCLPKLGAFDITEDLLKEYYLAYAKINGSITGTCSKGNTKLARRLAGLNLLKENIRRGIKASEIKAGHVYLISNPAFSLHYKIGVSFDVYKRLANYQTYSPFRDFKLEKFDFVIDKFKTEKLILNHPLLNREYGEWVLKDNAKTIFNDMSTYYLNENYSECW